MIRIYCQYTIAGFKIFNLCAFPNTMPKGRFVRMNDISKGLEGERQDIFVTRDCDCGLDRRIMNLFSMNSVSLMLLRHCGSEKNETYLFLGDHKTQTAFAFATKEAADVEVFIRIAAAWISEKKGELVRRLQNLVGKPVIDDEPTFAFYETRWEELLNDLKNMKIPLGKVESLVNSEKNLLVYLNPKKEDILKQAKINTPISSFITIPGNEEMRLLEQRQRFLLYAASGLAIAIVLGALIYYITH
jgi:hypothetical protein